MSNLVSQLVDEVIEKVMEGEAILKLIENVEMEDQVLVKIVNSVHTKRLINKVSEHIESIPDWIVRDMSPTMMNKLKKDETYIAVFESGTIHIANVVDIDNLYVSLEFLESKMNAGGGWIKKSFKGIYKYLYEIVPL